MYMLVTELGFVDVTLCTCGHIHVFVISFP